jgi:hypothetical protein
MTTDRTLADPDVVIPGQLSFDDAATEHYHLTLFGHSVCHDPQCTRRRDDPADDMACTDPDPANCEGACAAAQYNAARRAHLQVPPGWLNPNTTI